MKLKVYQQGGGLIYTPFIPGQSIAASGSSSNSSDSEDAKIDPLDKVLMDLMKDQNLLPSDIDAIYRNLIKFQKSTQYLSSSDGYRSVMPGMLKIMNMTSVAKTNKEQWDNSLSEIRKHDAGSEVAMDSYGRIWVSDGSDIKKIELSEFDPSKYSPLSNSQLLYMRQRNPQLGFSDMFDDTWTDVVGMDDVRAEIYNIIDNFGSIKSPKYQKQSMKDIASDLKGDGIFKITEKYSKADLNDFSGLLYNQLSREAKNLINANAKIGGFSTEDFIRSIISSQTDIDIDSSYEASLTKANGLGGEGGSGSDGSGSLKEDNYQIRFANGDGTEVQFALVPKGSEITSKSGMMVQALDFGPMLNWDQLPLGQMNLQSALFDGSKKSLALNTSVRSTDVTFGNKLLDYSELPAIMYNNDSLTTKVYLPYRNENGHFVPDFQKIENFNEYRKVIKGKTLSTTEKNALLQKYNLSASDIKVSDDGRTIELIDTMPFLAFSAYAGDKTIKFTDDQKRYLSKVDSSKGRVLKDGYNKSLKYNDVYAKKDAAIINNGFKESGAGDFWEGIVFIPCPNAFYAYNSTKNQYLHPDEFNDIAAKVTINEYENQLRNAAKSDPNYNDYSKIGQW